MSATQFTLCSFNFQSIPLLLSTDEENIEAFGAPADVYCLQGVTDVDRPQIKELESKGFQIIRIEGVQKNSGKTPVDTVVAVSTKKFRNIENCSRPTRMTIPGQGVGGDLAIAKATDKETNQEFTFVSLQVPIFEPSQGGKIINSLSIKESYHFTALDILESSAGMGKRIEIIGTDIGAQGSFSDIFENEADFTKAKASEEVGAGVVFSKITQSVGSQIASIFCQNIENCVEVVRDEGVLETDNTKADLPLFITVSSKITDSKIAQLCEAIVAFLKNLFKCIAVCISLKESNDQEI